MIRLRTGLRFEIQRTRSLGNMIDMIQHHETDIISAISPSVSRESQLNFSRPYLENSFVLVTEKGPDHPSNLEQLAGKRLALTLGNPLTPYLRKEFPGITLVETDDIYQATQLVAEGKVEGRSTRWSLPTTCWRLNYFRTGYKSARPLAPNQPRSR